MTKNFPIHVPEHTVCRLGINDGIASDHQVTSCTHCNEKYSVLFQAVATGMAYTFQNNS